MKTKNNKKNIILTILLMVGCLLLGFITGYFPSSYAIPYQEIGSWILDISSYIIPPVFFIIIAFEFILTLNNYKKAKKIYATWDKEDDEHISKAERIIEASTGFLSVCFVVLVMLTSIWGYLSLNRPEEELTLFTFILDMGIFASFIGNSFFYIFMLRGLVQLMKRINPEKRGEVLSPKFDKEWEESLDEAQKLATYKAGYRTFKFMNYAFVVAWLISVAGMNRGLGLAPVVIISLLWLVMTVAGAVYSYKFSYKNKKR